VTCLREGFEEVPSLASTRPVAAKRRVVRAR